MTGKFRFSNEHFPPDGKPRLSILPGKTRSGRRHGGLSPTVVSKSTPPPRTPQVLQTRSRPAARNQVATQKAALLSVLFPSPGRAVPGSRPPSRGRKHRRRTGNGVGEAAQDSPIPPYDMAEDTSAERVAEQKPRLLIENCNPDTPLPHSGMSFPGRAAFTTGASRFA
jgi:hypothetical protein